VTDIRGFRPVAQDDDDEIEGEEPDDGEEGNEDDD
jgi:hypothetical protein